MDLPPDKAKLLKNYDDEKKWDIICDQVSNFKVITLLFDHIVLTISFNEIKLYTENTHLPRSLCIHLICCSLSNITFIRH